MRTIWVVQGSTGEYSGHTEWLLKAFVCEQEAQRLVVEAQARANEIAEFKNDDWEAYVNLERLGSALAVNEFDPQMAIDYTGTHYTCFAVELVEEA